jgi:hypothetical protein
MRKLKLLALVLVVCFVASCGDDSPLKECFVCTASGSSTPEPEYCANKVTAEAYKTTMESGGYSCVKK